MRRAFGLVALAGAAVGAAFYLRRRSDAESARADLYFEDGSMLSLDRDAPEIDGAVHIASRRPLRVGEIVTVKIETAGPYDLRGMAV